jgi:hypothetical protein
MRATNRTLLFPRPHQHLVVVVYASLLSGCVNLDALPSPSTMRMDAGAGSSEIDGGGSLPDGGHMDSGHDAQVSRMDDAGEQPLSWPRAGMHPCDKETVPEPVDFGFDTRDPGVAVTRDGLAYVTRRTADLSDSTLWYGSTVAISGGNTIAALPIDVPTYSDTRIEVARDGAIHVATSSAYYLLRHGIAEGDWLPVSVKEVVA